MRRSGSARIAAAAVALTVAVALAGCGGSQPVTADGSEAPGVPATTTGADPQAHSAELTTQRERLGIDSCAQLPPAGATGGPESAPAVDLPCLDGSQTVNLAGLSGTPAVVNLWATWCGPCRDEAPFLAAVAGDDSVEVNFVGVDIDDPDPAAALEMAAEFGWDYPQIADPDRAFLHSMGVQGVPQTLFVDEQGQIVYRHAGAFTSEEQLRTLIADHLDPEG